MVNAPDGRMNKILIDYQLEEMLWSEKSWNQIRKKEKVRERYVWRHRVQYAVSHAVNEYYTLLPEVRREVPIQYLLEKRWPRQISDFDSVDHYWQVKFQVTNELIRVMSQRAEYLYPTLLFEELSIFVPVLQMDLTVIFQTAWQLDMNSSSQLTIHKYMVSFHPEVIKAYQQLATVFCVHAFGKLPHCIEVDCLMEGMKETYIPDDEDYLLALDYIKLAFPLCSLDDRTMEPVSLVI